MILTLCISPNARAEPIIVSPLPEMSKIGRYFEYLEVADPNLTVDDIIHNRHGGTWIQSQKDAPGFGFKQTVFWVRFTVKNTSSSEVAFFFEQAYPLVDSLKLFDLKSDGTHAVTEVGDIKPFSERPYEHSSFVFPLTIGPNAEKTYYLKQHTQSAMSLHFNIWSPDRFRKKALIKERMLMLYYGMALVIAIYNLFLYFFIRHISYLFYALYVFFFLLFIMTMNGTAFQFLWPNYPWFGNWCIPILLLTLIVFAVLFFLYFLKLKLTAPLTYKIVKYLITYVTIIQFAICSFAPYRISIRLTAIWTIVVCIFSLLAGFRLAFKKHRPAIFYTVSWAAFLIGALLFLFRVFAILDKNIVTDWALQIGSVFQLILLSTGLADRINTLRKESEILIAKTENAYAEQMNVIRVANRLSDMIDDLVHTVERVAASFSEKVQGQAYSIGSIITEVGSLKELARQTSSSAVSTRVTAEKSRAESLEGTHIVERLKAGFGEINEMNELSQAEFTDLAEKAEKIEDILESNREIADRIKILAINAAIQAAKAGEHGLGFRFVAGELKAMIADTEESLVKSHQLLGDIRARARQTSQTIEQGTKGLQKQTKELGLADKLMRRLADSFSETVDSVNAITGDAKLQEDRINKVGVGVDNIDLVAEQIEQAADKLITSVEKIVSSQGELRHVLAGTAPSTQGDGP
ncbi:MAG: 7TM diverse intracellular signaling domain-containing protein [Myxococcota bacterium]|nr:7TM diverse intracellular signaling domain-containing protein [Myxococcota bacterium]